MAETTSGDVSPRKKWSINPLELVMGPSLYGSVENGIHVWYISLHLSPFQPNVGKYTIHGLYGEVLEDK